MANVPPSLFQQLMDKMRSGVGGAAEDVGNLISRGFRQGGTDPSMAPGNVAGGRRSPEEIDAMTRMTPTPPMGEMPPAGGSVVPPAGSAPPPTGGMPGWVPPAIGIPAGGALAYLLSQLGLGSPNPNAVNPELPANRRLPDTLETGAGALKEAMMGKKAPAGKPGPAQPRMANKEIRGSDAVPAADNRMPMMGQDELRKMMNARDYGGR